MTPKQKTSQHSSKLTTGKSKKIKYANSSLHNSGMSASGFQKKTKFNKAIETGLLKK